MTDEPIKVLLVDDIADNLVALVALLRREGLELLTARSGAEALELLLVHEVSLALVDVQMPEMDGFELAELMRGAERTKHVPIIFVTAGTRDPRRLFKGYESGAVDFLYKPVDAMILKSKVDVFLELARQRQELSQALRLNEIFVGILGHDLRNPLGSLVAGVELLGRQLREARQLETLGRMASAGRRMSELIEQMLDLTRARLGGGLGFARGNDPLDVADLVKHAISELRVSHPDREIRLEQHGNSQAIGDADRLVQLFSNVLGNALDHGVTGTAIDVTVEGSPSDIVVEVANRGEIPPELLPSVFEPFRGRSQRATSSGGLGLGLYISREIATAHGGTISVSSNADVGTVVSVSLPRSTERSASAAPAG